MKRWIPFAIILAAGLLAILATERDKVSTRPSADAVLLCNRRRGEGNHPHSC